VLYFELEGASVFDVSRIELGDCSDEVWYTGVVEKVL
jgi:hypothetical protein